jgi:lysophospholipase L1-like esterase
MKNIIKNLTILLFSFALCFFVGEILLRTLIFDPNKSYVRTPGWSMAVRTNGKIFNISDSAGNYQYRVNKYGFRGEPPSSNAFPRIAIFGGSTVEDWPLRDDKTWVKQFEKSLKTETPRIGVANFGKSGVNARHHLIQLPEVLPNNPKFDVIIVLMGLNDFLYDYHIHHNFITANDWWRNQAFMYNKYDEGKIATIAIVNRVAKLVLQSKSNPPTSNFGDFMQTLYSAHKKITPNQIINSIPLKKEALQEYAKSILLLKNYADNYGAKIIFINQPFLWSKNMSEVSKKQLIAGFIGNDMNSPNTQWYSSSALEDGLSLYNKKMLEVCKEYTLNCIDLASLLPKDNTNYIDDFHFSEKGAEQVGKIIAKQITQNSFLIK